MNRRWACRACWLCETDAGELARLGKVRRRLPRGLLATYGLSKQTWWRHRHGRCKGRFPWWRGTEAERRRREGVRLAVWRWRPGESGRAQSARAKAAAADRRELAAAYREAAARLRGE